MENGKLIDRFRQLRRTTKWTQVDQVALQFNNYHSQGLLRIKDRFYMSSVELIEPPKHDAAIGPRYDRSPGKGRGHLFVFDSSGRLLRDVELGEGDMYHPGGIDTDGSHIWISLAEYRPQSQSIIYRVQISTLTVEEAFRVHDHIGGIVCDIPSGMLMGYSWGSRKLYRWKLNGQLVEQRENPSHFIDYQDGHYCGDGKMILSGISELPLPLGGKLEPYELGGLALIDMHTWQTIHEVPIPIFSRQGHVITRNPVFMDCEGDRLRLYAVPDDDNGSLLVYETSY